MGILNYINQQKKEFRNEEEKKRIKDFRQAAIKGEIEIYEPEKKNIRNIITNAKQQFKDKKNKINLLIKEREEKQKEKLTQEYAKLKLQTQVEKQKSQLNKYKQPNSLERLTQNLNRMGGNNQPRTIKKNKKIFDKTPRNIFGGRDPF